MIRQPIKEDTVPKSTTSSRRTTKATPKRKASEEDVAPKRRPARRVAKQKAAKLTTKTVVLAMSPRAANILRATLGRMRYEDEPELDAIKKELNDQLSA